MIVRSETPGDIAAIRAVEEAAFRQSAEAQLVDDLRDAGDSVFSLVAVDDETVIGHALFSRMKAPFPALALGPVAVLPECQRTGIGSRLIRAGNCPQRSRRLARNFRPRRSRLLSAFRIRCRQGERLYLALCRTASDGAAAWTERTSDKHGKHSSMLPPLQSSARQALSVEPEMAHDLLRGHIRRIHPGIQLEAIGPRHGGEVVAVELPDQVLP